MPEVTKAEGRKLRLSVSALGMLEGCGEQYYRRYVKGDKIPPNSNLIIGTATDKSVTADLGKKIRTGTLLGLDECQTLARDAVHNEISNEGLLLDPEEKSAGEGATIGAAVDAAVSLATLHHGTVAPKIEPIEVQREWVLEVSGLPVDLHGVIDIDELEATRDTKTSSKSPSKPETSEAVDISMQMTLYAMARKVLDGEIPKRLILDFLVKTKTPKYVPIVGTKTQADFEPVLERILNASKAIETGVFVPARPDDWRCSPNYCGYYHTCKYAMKPKSVAMGGLILPSQIKQLK